MKRMLCLLLVFFLLAPCTVQARAEAFDASDGFHVSDSFDLSGQLDARGAGELPELLPDEARELMDEAGVGEMKVESLLHLSPGDFFQAVWKAFLTQLRGPLKMLGFCWASRCCAPCWAECARGFKAAACPRCSGLWRCCA